MTTTQLILEILKYTLPAGMVLAAVAVILRENRTKQETKERYQILQKTFAEMVPLRLQAYERAILFLERISPEHLIIRCDGNGKSARVFHLQMTMEIRAEYEHNIAQQLYIKQDSWMELARAKEQVLSLINQTAAKLGPDAPGIELGKKILQEMTARELAPTHGAIRALKGDVQQMFRF